VVVSELTDRFDHHLSAVRRHVDAAHALSGQPGGGQCAPRAGGQGVSLASHSAGVCYCSEPFSAAVADIVAAGENVAESTQGCVDEQRAYVLICGIAIVLAFASTLTILSFASRAFAFYYFLQCLVAISVTEKTAHKVAISLLAAVLLFITMFAVPAGGGLGPLPNIFTLSSQNSFSAMSDCGISTYSWSGSMKSSSMIRRIFVVFVSFAESRVPWRRSGFL
jgi:hypothetical protein